MVEKMQIIGFEEKVLYEKIEFKNELLIQGTEDLDGKDFINNFGLQIESDEELKINENDVLTKINFDLLT